MKKIILTFCVIAIIILIYILDLNSYLSIEYVLEQKNDLVSFVDRNLIIAIIAFIFVYIMTITLSLPGATVLTITGGMLFGLYLGILIVMICALTGASINFYFARYIIGDKLQMKYRDKLVKFNAEMARNGHNYLLTLRLIPLLPFFLVNLLAGLTNIKFKTFFWTTVVGVIPGGLFYIYAGTTLKSANSVSEILGYKTIIPLTILGLIAFIPVIINRRKVMNEE